MASKYISAQRIEISEKLSTDIKEGTIEEIIKNAKTYSKTLQDDTNLALCQVGILENLYEGNKSCLIVTDKFCNYLKDQKNNISEKPLQKKHVKNISNGKQKSVPVTKEIHIGRLNFIVGRIIKIEKHPCADSLYVEKVDVGFEKYITVCSGLVNKISIEELDQKLAVFCCNLKPVKMRGIMSEGMIMCASDDNRVELLKPPPESNIGDRVTCPEFNCDPDLILNPKEKAQNSNLYFRYGRMYNP
ncbi:hypothetical protein HZS_2358, partial [Henneguya salminicola]